MRGNAFQWTPIISTNDRHSESELHEFLATSKVASTQISWLSLEVSGLDRLYFELDWTARGIWHKAERVWKTSYSYCLKTYGIYQ